MLALLKIMFLFLAVFFGAINIGKTIYGQNLPGGNLIFMTVGIVGFIVIQYEMYLWFYND